MITTENPYKSSKNIDYIIKNDLNQFCDGVTSDNDDNELRKHSHVCSICSRRFSKLSHLNRHKFSHTKEKHFRCNYCDKSYSRNDHLQRHLITHGLNSKPYICPFEGCNLTFYDSSKFRKHYPVHNKLEDNCIIFGQKVQITKVNDKNMLNCPITGCKMLTKTVHGMRRHIFSHGNKRERVGISNNIIEDQEEGCSKQSDIVKRVYICGYGGCNYSYSRKSNAIAHINVCHKNLKFTCDKCHLAYKWKRSLNKHKCKETLENIE